MGFMLTYCIVLLLVSHLNYLIPPIIPLFPLSQYNTFTIQLTHTCSLQMDM